jgi:hypothetical protein
MTWSLLLLTTGACECAIEQEFVIPVKSSQVFTVDSMSLISNLLLILFPFLYPVFIHTV